MIQSVTDLGLTRAMQYTNHSAVAEHMDLAWKKLYEAVRRHRALVMDIESSFSWKGHRLAPLSAVLSHRVRIIDDYSFEAGAGRGVKGRQNRAIRIEELPMPL